MYLLKEAVKQRDGVMIGLMTGTPKVQLGQGHNLEGEVTQALHIQASDMTEVIMELARPHQHSWVIIQSVNHQTDIKKKGEKSLIFVKLLLFS